MAERGMVWLGLEGQSRRGELWNGEHLIGEAVAARNGQFSRGTAGQVRARSVWVRQSRQGPA
jgi:hypothetical protein